MASGSSGHWCLCVAAAAGAADAAVIAVVAVAGWCKTIRKVFSLHRLVCLSLLSLPHLSPSAISA